MLGAISRLTYSPDLNRIEMMFAEALLRKAAERTINNLGSARQNLDEFSPKECSNYVRYDG
jgi:hypothetical protein